MKKNLIFLDTETTGNQANDRLVQLAYKTPGQAYGDMFDELYKPPVPISIESMAVHHITPAMVADKPAFVGSEHYMTIKELLQSPDTVVIAHNAKFDLDMLEKENIRVSNYIDTLRLVRHFDPEMKMARQNLQYVRYFLELDKDIDEPVQAHDAKGDVIILEKLFDRLYKKTADAEKIKDEDKIIERMMELSTTPTLIGAFTFGKHRGKSLKDVAIEDRGYLQWLLGQKEQSDNLEAEEDWIYTLRHYLGN